MRVLIVDCHSVIFTWPELRAMHARRNVLARDALVKWLTEYQDATGAHVVAVFDGKGTRANEASEPGGIQIFYSGADQTADDIIERLAAKYGAQHDITVATSDLLEAQTVSTFGALTVSADGLQTLIEEARADVARALRKLNRG